MKNFLIFVVIVLNFIDVRAQLTEASTDYSDYFHKTINHPTPGNFYNYSEEGSVDHLTGKFGINVLFHTIETEYLNLPISLNYSTSGVSLDMVSGEVGVDWGLIAGGQISRQINDVQDNLGTVIYSDFRFSDANGNLKPTNGDVGYASYNPNIIRTMRTGYGAEKGNTGSRFGSWFINNFPKRIEFLNDTEYSEVGSLIEMTQYEKFPVSNELSSAVSLVVDTEPDIFRCKVGDLDFSFVFKRKFSNMVGGHHQHTSNEIKTLYEPVAIDEIGIKIDYEVSYIPYHNKVKNPLASNTTNEREGSDLAYTKFIVTDKKGVVYTFENFDFIDQDIIQEALVNTSIEQNNRRVFQWKTYNTSTNNWKLTNIKLPDNNMILFNYIPNKRLYHTRPPRMHDGRFLGESANPDYGYHLSPMLTTYALDHLDINIEGHSLSEIIYLNQRLKFHYSNYRPDFKSGGLNLDKIELWHKDEYIAKSFKLTKTFSYADMDNGHEDYRMFLQKIEDSTKEKSYTFNYENIDGLPSRGHSKYQDIFGYFVGNLSPLNSNPAFPQVYILKNAQYGNTIQYERPVGDYLTINNGADRSVKINAANRGTMNRIDFPTGGKVEITYENNTYFNSLLLNHRALGPGVRVKELNYYISENELNKKSQFIYDTFDTDLSISRSTGVLLHKPSFAYIGNWNLNHYSHNRKLNVETKVFDIYDFDSRKSFYEEYSIRNHNSKEELTRLGKSDNHIYEAMIKLSTHSLRNKFDYFGREIMYSSVLEKHVNLHNNSQSVSTQYYFNSSLAKPIVNSVTGPSDDPSDFVKGTASTSYSIFLPFYSNLSNGQLKSSSGLIERKGNDIYPFPENNYFGDINSRLLGKLIKKEYYDSYNNLKYFEEYEYDQISYNTSSLVHLKTGFLKTHLYYANDLQKRFNKEYKFAPDLTYSQADVQSYHGVYLFSNNKIVLNSKIIPSRKTVTNILESGNITESYDYDYISQYGNISRESHLDSKGNILATNYTYPVTNDDYPWQNRMLEKNIIQAHKIRSNLNNTTIKETDIVYKQWENGSVLPEYITSGVDEYAGKLITQVTKRDAQGRVLEFLKENGNSVSLIWAYNKSLVVAQLENTTYGQIPPQLIAAIQNSTDSDTYSEAELVGFLNSVRITPALSDAMITTYTYKPLIGISIITEPSGNKTTFQYNAAGKLELVRDHNGNIVSESKYNYRTGI